MNRIVMAPRKVVIRTFDVRYYAAPAHMHRLFEGMRGVGDEVCTGTHSTRILPTTSWCPAPGTLRIVMPTNIRLIHVSPYRVPKVHQQHAP